MVSPFFSPIVSVRNPTANKMVTVMKKRRCMGTVYTGKEEG